MKLIQKNKIYLIEAFFPKNILAGFTSDAFDGNVAEFSEIISEYSGISISYAYMDQVHSQKVIDVEAAGKYVCDGLVTHKTKLMLIVKTADCMPVILYSPSNGNISVIHMGWKPAKLGIFANIEAKIAEPLVFAGVGLRKCCYEVGHEFREFAEFKGSLLENEEKLFLDPINFINKKLITKKERLFDSNLCTICGKETFPSHRKNKTKKRTLSFIVKLS